MSKDYDRGLFDAEIEDEKVQFRLGTDAANAVVNDEGIATDEEARAQFMKYLKDSKLTNHDKETVIELAMGMAKLIQSRIGYGADHDFVYDIALESTIDAMGEKYSKASLMAHLPMAVRMLKETGWMHGTELFESIRTTPEPRRGGGS